MDNQPQETPPQSAEEFAATQAQYAAAPHVCSLCDQTFDNYQSCLDHVCPKTGFTPRDNEHFGPEFAAVSAAAQERGAADVAAGDVATPPQ